MRGQRTRRMGIYAVVGLGVLVVAAFVARRVFLDDSTHRVGTDSALDAYRHQSTTTAAPFVSSTTSASAATPSRSLRR